MMKLSTAIREGAKLHPKGKHDFATFDEGEFYTCALGAAYEAIHGRLAFSPDINTQRDIFSQCGIDAKIAKTDWVLPTNPREKGFLGEIIVILNDHEDWSREDIAAYLERKGL